MREGQGQGNQTPRGKTGNFGSKLKSLSVVTGRKVINNETEKKFAAAPRDIFVYNAHPNTTIEDVKEVILN